MSWTWVSDFPNDQSIFDMLDTGFPDPGQYVDGVGFISADVQIAATPTYCRILWMESFEFIPTEINSIEMNYDYTKGATTSGVVSAIALRITKSDDTSSSVSIIFNDTVNGAGQTLLFEPNQLDVKQVAVFIRSSLQGSASYSGSLALNSLTIIGGNTGGGTTLNPFDDEATFQSPTSYIDDQGAGAAGGAGGDAGGHVADISADAEYIYIAAFSSIGNPRLIRMPADLSANGDIVFDPGAGGRIGVQAGRFNDQHLWVAGEFDGTNTVEKSEDYGATWTVKDDGTFGVIRTFEVGPDSDQRVLVFDADNSDLIETTDDGANWTTTNAAVTPVINSIARLSPNPPELVAGNQGAANDNVNYSPNTGANLEDLVFPVNADVTKVQVS